MQKLNVRQDFPMITNNPDLVYLDNASTTFKPKCVIDTINRYYNFESVNVHRGDYDLSQDVSKKYDNVRHIVKEFINVNLDTEIVYTSGASESLNLVAEGYGKKFLKENDVILTTEAEHASNILPWFKVAKEKKAIIKYIPLNKDGSFSLENFKEVMNESVKVVTIAHITNVLGYVIPLKEVCEIAHSYGAIVACDGAQSVPHIKTDVKDSNVDFLAFSAHKLLGPTGVGVLYGKYDLLDKMNAFMVGGGSNLRFDMCGNLLLKNPPHKFEAGTPPIEAVLGMGRAIEYLMEIGMENVYSHEQELYSYMKEKINSLDNIIVYNKNCDSGILAFNIKDIFAQDAGAYFNSKNIAVRSGNHCAKILMEVLGIQFTLRASLYLYNTKEDIDRFVDAIKNINIEDCIDLVL